MAYVIFKEDSFTLYVMLWWGCEYFMHARRCVAGNDSHNSSVVSLHSSKDNSLIMSGSTDMTAKLVTATTGKVRLKIKQSLPIS